MKKKLLITAIATASLLIGGVAFASSSIPTIDPHTGTVTVPANLTAPSNKPVESQAPAQVAQEAPEAARSAETAQAPSAPAQAATAPETQPQTVEPAAPAVPVTVTHVTGSNVRSVVNPGMTFTCTYHFSDGTSVSRQTAYTTVVSSAPQAICPDWEA